MAQGLRHWGKQHLIGDNLTTAYNIITDTLELGDRCKCEFIIAEMVNDK